jgi:hypothetical protein
MAFCRDAGTGVLVYPNGDLQPIGCEGDPEGALIPGPPGASNVEEVECGTVGESVYVIRSGCVFWDCYGGSWDPPCEPLGTGASAAEAESWSGVKSLYSE